ncbi:cytochrome c3 family protein [Geobacter sp.]|uniref:cytochrome c3 family protein n=1 Tax=Geobacter sp. TaxID=46610 RepID=UPI00260F1008|nr:cytochrome c3 family protein [Geobacter sp.]
MKRLIVPSLLLLFIPVLLFANDYKIVTFSTANAGKVQFGHPVHLSALGHDCTLCHNSVFTIGAKAAPVTMAEMEKGKSCGTCHNGKRAFPLSACTRCHITKEVAVDIPDFGAVTFSHKFHLGLGAFGCGDCHNAIFKASTDNPHASMAEMERGKSCGACHDGSTAFTVKENCTRCHTVRNIGFAADAQFSHANHLGLGTFGCRDCHSRLFIAGPNSKRYTMADMETGTSCGGCHNDITAFSVKGNCGTCHVNVKDVGFEKSDAFFSHQVHTKILNCDSCHSGIFIGGVNSRRYTMAEMEKGESCGVCHEGKTVFGVQGNCDKCHVKTKDIPFRTTAAGTVTFSHSVHRQMYGCTDCHNGIFTAGKGAKRYTMADMAKGQSCGACHDGKTAFSATSADACAKCHPLRDVTLALDARFPHAKHLGGFSCGDCHNALFKAGPGNRRWTMPQMEQGNSCGTCHDGTTAFSVKGDCDKCHKTTSDVTFNSPQAGPTRFSHKFHLGLGAYGCGDCHNGIFTTGVARETHTMADMEKGQSCGACHDGKSAFTVRENCTKCHPVKEITFAASGARFSHSVHIGMFRCNDCHDALYKPGAGNRRVSMPEMEKGQSCGACHDGKSAFSVTGSCEKCHPVTKAIKFEFPAGTASVVFSHKSHTGRGLGCLDCHGKIVTAGVSRKPHTMKDMEKGESCGACHGFSMAFSVSDPINCEKCHQERF